MNGRNESGRNGRVVNLSVEQLEPRVAPMAAFFSESQVEDPQTRCWVHQAIGTVTKSPNELIASMR